MEGVWQFDAETGEFTLAEPYASEVNRIKRSVTDAFNTTLFEEVARISQYSVEQLEAEYVRRISERNDSPVDKVTSFIVEAMTGEL